MFAKVAAGLRVAGFAIGGTADAANHGAPLVVFHFHASPGVAAEVGFAAENHGGNAVSAGGIDAEIRLITADATFFEDLCEGVFFVGVEAIDGALHEVFDHAVGVAPVAAAYVHFGDGPVELLGGYGGANDPNEIACGAVVNGCGELASFVFLHVPAVAGEGLDGGGLAVFFVLGRCGDGLVAIENHGAGDGEIDVFFALRFGSGLPSVKEQFGDLGKVVLLWIDGEEDFLHDFVALKQPGKKHAAFVAVLGDELGG